MDFAGLFRSYVRDKAEHGNAWPSASLGLKLFALKCRLLPDKSIARGYQKLESIMMDHTVSALTGKRYALTSVFAPHEILLSSGILSLSSEALSCMLSYGYGLEDAFIDRTESLGIAPSLCSYHKAFIGASDLIPPPCLIVSSSLACDGNLCSFRYLSETEGLPFSFIDVPYGKDADSIAYLAGQLEELAYSLPSFSLDALRKTIEIENATREELIRFYQLAAARYYPGKLMDQMYGVMAFHSLLGTEELLDWIRSLCSDLEDAPELTGKRILWSHVIPFYSEPLRRLFDSSERYQVLASDMLLDSFTALDSDRPFWSLAEKMVCHAFSGPYNDKLSHLDRILELYPADGIIAFSQWGCRQASGGLPLLKEHFRKKGIPVLILDGDAVDRRNSQDGQIGTRTEAFLELLEGMA